MDALHSFDIFKYSGKFKADGFKLVGYVSDFCSTSPIVSVGNSIELAHPFGIISNFRVYGAKIPEFVLSSPNAPFNEKSRLMPARESIRKIVEQEENLANIFDKHLEPAIKLIVKLVKRKFPTLTFERQGRSRDSSSDEHVESEQESLSGSDEHMESECESLSGTDEYMESEEERQGD